MITVKNLSKHYGGITAVKSISFEVKTGETLGLIGTSGCGKTTTLKMLNRLIEPSGGTIEIGGQDVRQQRPDVLRRGIGYVIQNTGLFPHYTVAQNVGVVPQLLHWPKARIQERTWELLTLVGLLPQDFAQRYPHELSGGQQQRVGIARALAADPPIVLLDEPFGALDQMTRQQIQREFKQLESLLHKTMVLVTHDVFEAVTLCDRLCIMDQGEIMQLGTPKDVLFKPAHPFVERFFQPHRFQLELQVMTLWDLLPLAPEGSPPDLTQGLRYEIQDSVFHVLETLPAHWGDRQGFTIWDDQGQHRGVLACQDLLPLFFAAKAQLYTNFSAA